MFVAIPNVASPLVGDEKRGCAAHKGRRYGLNRQALRLWGVRLPGKIVEFARYPVDLAFEDRKTA